MHGTWYDCLRRGPWILSLAVAAMPGCDNGDPLPTPWHNPGGDPSTTSDPGATDTTGDNQAADPLVGDGDAPSGDPAVGDSGAGDGTGGDANAGDAPAGDAVGGDGGCPDCDACLGMPAPLEPGVDPFPGESPAGRYEQTTRDGFHDDYLYDNANYLKVGIRREWGGSIIYYGLAGTTGPGMNGNNTIDANDTGREVQVAFYDPDRAKQNCAWNASCADEPSDCLNSITFLGWNPVQGGNRCNVGSGVESVTSENGVLTATTNPLFWNPNWDRTDCSDAACSSSTLRSRRSDVRVVQRLKFIKQNIVELSYDLINLSSLNHRVAGQEMPTVYTANGGDSTQDLWRLFNSQGTEIAIDQPANDGFFYKNFSSPGGWATMQNDALNYGVGLYNENRLTQMQGWQNRALPFNNFRPQFAFGLPANGTVRAHAYLLIGSLSTISADAGWLDSHLPPFGWLDQPAVDAVVSGNVSVGGWALDNIGVDRVWALVDGTASFPLTYGTARADVPKVWPGYPDGNNVGFSGSFNSSGLTPCYHLIEILAEDTHDNVRVIARRRVRVAG
jgi:hypothetical protein